MLPFYHISLDVENKIDTFKPQIPSSVYMEEDSQTPRICLSESIQGCLSATPWGGRKLENTQASFTEVCGSEFNMVFRVYEFDENTIPVENIVKSEQLVKNGLVMDAENSKEVWVVNQDLKPIKSYIALLNFYDEQLKDVFSKEYYSLTEEDWEDVDDIEEFIIGASTKIVNAELSFYESIEDLPITVDWGKWKEIKEKLKNANYEFTY